MRSMRTRGSDNHQLAPEGPGGHDLASDGDTRNRVKKLLLFVSGRAMI